jgi:8-oxo-dGTP pyrophosphatase MutT (NUDIX family)
MSDDPFEQVLFEHPLLRAVAFGANTPAGMRPFLRLEIDDWVNVVTVTADDRLVLVRQHRWGIDRSCLEIPGGVVDPGETPAEAARREVLEETGYGAGTLVPMGFVWSNPAIQTNRTWLFALTGTEKVAEVALDATEDIAVELHDLDTLPELLRSGRIDHVFAVVSLQRFLLRGEA